MNREEPVAGGLSADQNVGYREPKQKHISPKEKKMTQEIRYMTITVENCKNIIEGMNGDHNEAPVHDRARENVQWKDNQYQMRQKTGDQTNQGRSSKAGVLGEHQCPVCQGKALKDGMAIGECNVKEDTSDPRSEKGGIDEVKLSDVAAHGETASRRSDARMEV